MGWVRYLVALAALVGLKIVNSLGPVMTLVAASLESQIESWADLDFKFRRRPFNWSSLLDMAAGLSADKGRKAYKGLTAPNIKLAFMDHTPCRLFDFSRPFRPLVVNFISNLDEPIWSELKKFNVMVKKMSWMADFLTVVVGCGVVRSRSDWHSMLSLQSPDCLRHVFCVQDPIPGFQDRRTVASFLVDAGIAGDLVYDRPGNDALQSFAPTPERLFVIYQEDVVYDSGRGGKHGGYQLTKLSRRLWRLYRGKVLKDQENLDTQYRPCYTPFIQHQQALTAERRPSTHTAQPCPSPCMDSTVADVCPHVDLTQEAGPSILKTRRDFDKHETIIDDDDDDDDRDLERSPVLTASSKKVSVKDSPELIESPQTWRADRESFFNEDLESGAKHRFLSLFNRTPSLQIPRTESFETSPLIRNEDENK